MEQKDIIICPECGLPVQQRLKTTLLDGTVMHLKCFAQLKNKRKK